MRAQLPSPSRVSRGQGGETSPCHPHLGSAGARAGRPAPPPEPLQKLVLSIRAAVTSSLIRHLRQSAWTALAGEDTHQEGDLGSRAPKVEPVQAGPLGKPQLSTSRSTRPSSALLSLKLPTSGRALDPNLLGPLSCSRLS